MPEPLRLLLDAGRVRACGHHLQRVWPAFARAEFERQALAGLGSLELKARAMQIADALEATLPDDFDRAAGLIEAALAPPPAAGDDGPAPESEAGLAGWIGWPLGEFIARRGRAEPERGLQALHALTRRFTAEFAIRPYLRDHLALTLRTLQHWCGDPSAQVRRLVSEGSRPRLPWALQVRALIADPQPTRPLLLALQDDRSETVRRSVANHLNDISRDHPGALADWLEHHLPGASPQRRALLRHASRTLIKRGDPRVLASWGLGEAFEGEARLRVAPRRVRLGQGVQLSLVLHSRAAARRRLAIDYIVHHVKANGATSPKVFKGWLLELAPGERRLLARNHPLRPITTRAYYPGEHRVEIQANGRVVATASFRLEVD